MKNHIMASAAALAVAVGGLALVPTTAEAAAGPPGGAHLRAGRPGRGQPGDDAAGHRRVPGRDDVRRAGPGGRSRTSSSVVRTDQLPAGAGGAEDRVRRYEHARGRCRGGAGDADHQRPRPPSTVAAARGRPGRSTSLRATTRWSAFPSAVFGLTKPASFTVAGDRRAGALPATQATIRAVGPVGDNRWTFRQSGAPVKWLRFANASKEIHFLDMAGVKPGTTAGDVRKAFASPNEPKFFTGEGITIEVVSPGVAIALKGPVAPGRYLLTCFVPSRVGRDAARDDGDVEAGHCRSRTVARDQVADGRGDRRGRRSRHDDRRDRGRRAAGPAAPASARDDPSCSRITDPERRERCEASDLGVSHSPMDMGRPDYGKPSRGRAHAHGSATPIDDLTGPVGAPQRSITLTAATGRQVIGGIDQPVLTFNGTTPGPTLVLQQGELVEVRLRNADVAQGVTIHWHGVDVPGREDGVAGVTQDAVLPGGEYVYRFVVPDAGTYWYHTHQDSVRSVARGLLGALIVLPSPTPSTTAPEPFDVTALVHTYGPVTTINGAAGSTAVPAARGRDGPRAHDQLRQRTPPRDGLRPLPGARHRRHGRRRRGRAVRHVRRAARRRPSRPAGAGGPPRARASGSWVGQASSSAPTGRSRRHSRPVSPSTPLTYGTPGDAQLARAALGPVNVRFDYRVGRKLGFLDGRFGDWYTINGRTIPDVPMFMVRRDDVVLVRVANRTPLVHPMHLHGHHALVVARNGVPATGAAWWVDSLDVASGESYDLMLVADNPGVWMFHCHNLPHARAGLMTHLMYEGVSTPYRIGRVSRAAGEPAGVSRDVVAATGERAGTARRPASSPRPPRPVPSAGRRQPPPGTPGR